MKPVQRSKIFVEVGNHSLVPSFGDRHVLRTREDTGGAICPQSSLRGAERRGNLFGPTLISSYTNPLIQCHQREIAALPLVVREDALWRIPDGAAIHLRSFHVFYEKESQGKKNSMPSFL